VIDFWDDEPGGGGGAVVGNGPTPAPSPAPTPPSPPPAGPAAATPHAAPPGPPEPHPHPIAYTTMPNGAAVAPGASQAAGMTRTAAGKVIAAFVRLYATG
jgi:hypothetical protein